ncbi:MAG: hypothetical protein ACYCW6_02895 [Candidatus Xenobia bacterium]
MPDLRRLMTSFAQAEEAFKKSRFLAPCVRGGQVRTRIVGVISTFRPEPADYHGWGIFEPRDARVARHVEDADLPLVEKYLSHLPHLRVILAFPLTNETWMAYPVNESDASQRWGSNKPLIVSLVTEGRQFDTVVVRGDGTAWWFEALDRRADPEPADRLRESLSQVVHPKQVRFKGLTPEMRTAYDLAAQQLAGFQAMRDEKRLRAALSRSGAQLRSYEDKGEYWVVEWTPQNGDPQISAITKDDLTVVSSGICLSGRDRDFDLQSLVGVIEQAWEV